MKASTICTFAFAITPALSAAIGNVTPRDDLANVGKQPWTYEEGLVVQVAN